MSDKASVNMNDEHVVIAELTMAGSLFASTSCGKIDFGAGTSQVEKTMRNS
jgi:hypothetical protein